ncbi:MAG: diaminopimelate epimerase [Lentisphaerae bacterium GWF2_38_69]|nr:MAG: diaminopimelate epimerase [Lentisphaerae bacterium GWF2_38_69]
MEFSKMHGAGNDFIIIDYRSLPGRLPESEAILKMCNRERGIGADGLIVLRSEKNSEYDFEMFFFNNDGSRESMCGNGLRCASLYAHRYFELDKQLSAKTDSGILRTQIIDERTVRIEIPYLEEFKKITVEGIELYAGSTGVPHAVLFVEDIKSIDVLKEGRYLRYHKVFGQRGTNVNFVSNFKGLDSVYAIRTYEKGVENETLACGTGISASAICAVLFKNAGKKVTFITNSKDELTVELPDRAEKFDKVFLTGPAIEVFKGRTICQF